MSIMGIKNSKIEIVFFILLAVISAIPRFTQLGYSHFYGDETKAMYVKKNFSATEFFFNQRKGPMQGLISWLTEKVSGGFSERDMRIPFAISGFLSVILFYFIVRAAINWQTAAVSSFLFSLNGFYLAFSRTVQYQSLLLFFGLFSILLCVLISKTANQRLKIHLLIGAGLFMGLSFLTHYDAVFFMVPSVLLLWSGGNRIRNIFIYGATTAIMASLFYVPYIFKGFFYFNTSIYMINRFAGIDSLPNNSLFTYNVYNPFYITFAFVVFIIMALLRLHKNYIVRITLVWFLVPFVAFEVVFSNPGTHIHNYVIPLFIFAGYGVYLVYCYLKNKIVRSVFSFVVVAALALITTIGYSLYIPAFHTGYPWKQSKFLTMDIPAVDRNTFQLFIYGFPYYRGWDQVRNFVFNQKAELARNFSTNDNVTVAEYYLSPLLAYHAKPQFYIYVVDGMLAKPKLPETEDIFTYFLMKEIMVDDEVTAQIYRRII